VAAGKVYGVDALGLKKGFGERKAKRYNKQGMVNRDFAGQKRIVRNTQIDWAKNSGHTYILSVTITK
jgi:hypothetical protein